MGPGPEGSSKADAQNALLPLALRAFPSPALSDGSLDSPTLQRTLASATTPAPWTPYSPFPDASAIMPSEPGVTRETLVMTPQTEHGSGQPNLASDMNLIVGGALAPISEVAPQRPVVKAGPGLRLPSFEAMGIASPHPDKIGLLGADAGLARERALGLALRSRSDPGRVESTTCLTPDIGSTPGLQHIQSPKPNPHPQQTPLHQYVHTLTPPAETGEPTWRPSIMTAVMDSPDTEPGLVSGQAETGDESVQAASGAMQNVTISAPAITGERTWLEEAVQAIRQSRYSCTHGNTLTTYNSFQPQNSVNTHTAVEGFVACTPQSFTDRPCIHQHYRSDP